MADADLILLVLDAPTLAAAGALAPEDLAILAAHSEPALAHLLLALNKSDLLPNPLQIQTLLAHLLPTQLQIPPAEPEPLGKPSLQAWPSPPFSGEEGALAPAPTPNAQRTTDNVQRTTDNAPPPAPSAFTQRNAVIPTEAGSAAAQSAFTQRNAVIPTEARQREVEGPPHLSFLPSPPTPNAQRPTYNVQRTTDNAPPPPHLIETSALTGLGIPQLRAAIVAAVAGPHAASRESALLTNLRQHQSVAESLRALTAAQAAVAARIPHEMLLVDLYAALRALDSLTGATTPDDVLRLIFSTFCIGK
jgi:hypothetical protein